MPSPRKTSSRPCVDVTEKLATALSCFDEPYSLEDSEVFADSLPGDRQAVSECGRGCFAALE